MSCLMGSCRASWRRFLYIGLRALRKTHVCDFVDTVTGNLAVFRVFITFRSMRDYDFFSSLASKLIFWPQKVYRFFWPWWSKDVLVDCRWRAVNFEIYLWSSGMSADCIWRSISIQHVQIEAGLILWRSSDDSFSVEIRDFMSMLNEATHQVACRRRSEALHWFDRINMISVKRSFTFSEMAQLYMCIIRVIHFKWQWCPLGPECLLLNIFFTLFQFSFYRRMSRCRLVGQLCAFTGEDFFT